MRTITKCVKTELPDFSGTVLNTLNSVNILIDHSRLFVK